MLDRQLPPRLAVQGARSARAAACVFRIDGIKLEQIGVVEHEDDLTTHPSASRATADALSPLLDRPRQGGADRHRTGKRGAERVLAEHPKADIGRVLTHPQTHVVEAAGAEHLTLDWIPLDERIAADLKHLHGELPGEIEIADRTARRQPLDRGGERGGGAGDLSSL